MQKNVAGTKFRFRKHRIGQNDLRRKPGPRHRAHTRRFGDHTPDDTGIQATLDRRQAAQAAWQTRHDPLDIGRTLAGISGDSAVLVDALPLWLVNRAEAGHDPQRPRRN